MTTRSIVYLAIGTILVLIGAAIKLYGRRKVAEDEWSHPVGVGLIIIGLCIVAGSFFNNSA